jgi:hypothetical protein
MLRRFDELMKFLKLDELSMFLNLKEPQVSSHKN